MAAGLGFKTFATGDVLTAADTNGYLMQGIWVFADAAARTAAVTSPQEGNMSYLKSDDTTYYYSGSAWVALGVSALKFLQGATFSAVASFSLPTSTFSTTYDNYLVLVDFTSTSGAAAITCRYRVSGTDTTTGYYAGGYAVPYTSSAYTIQNSATSAWDLNITTASAGSRSALAMTVFNPKSATAKIGVTGISNEMSGLSLGLWNSGSNAYDSLSFIKASGTMGGTYRVYGYTNS